MSIKELRLLYLRSGPCCRRRRRHPPCHPHHRRPPSKLGQGRRGAADLAEVADFPEPRSGKTPLQFRSRPRTTVKGLMKHVKNGIMKHVKNVTIDETCQKRIDETCHKRYVYSIH